MSIIRYTHVLVCSPALCLRDVDTPLAAKGVVCPERGKMRWRKHHRASQNAQQLAITILDKCTRIIAN